MAALPAIQIRQQFARIGIDADPGFMKIRQPQAHMEIHTEPAVVSIHSEPGRLQIDQSRAWDALGGKNILRTLDRIHAAARNVAWDNVARIAREGDRLADLTTSENTLAELGKEAFVSFHELDILPEASSGNVDMDYTPSPPEIQVQTGGVDIRVEVNRPELDYERGKLDIYVAQQAMLTIIPPQIDIQA